MTGTQQELPAVLWLRGTSDSAPRIGERAKALEAAELITELVEALETTVRHLRPGASDEERAAYKAGHAVLTKARASGDEK